MTIQSPEVQEWLRRQKLRPAIEHMVLANGEAPAGVTCGFCKSFRWRKGEFRCVKFGDADKKWDPAWTGCGKWEVRRVEEPKT